MEYNLTLTAHNQVSLRVAQIAGVIQLDRFASLERQCFFGLGPIFRLIVVKWGKLDKEVKARQSLASGEKV